MVIEKVLLLIAPAYTLKESRDINPLPPMGLGYLAAVIRNMDIEVRILDSLLEGWNTEEDIDNLFIRVGLPDSTIEEYIRDYNPDLVGINCQFSRQNKIYHQMFSLVKKIKPDCITMGGGAHVTVCPEEILKDKNCDFIILGEAEESLKDFVSKINRLEAIEHVDGLGWKKNGELHINEKKNWITDLDSIPFPAYDVMGLEKYTGLEASHGLRHKARFCPVITSRGCPAKCTFCSAHKVWGKRYRTRSVENVIKEMRFLRDKYKIEELMFEDDNVTADSKRAKELFARMVNEKFNFIWDTPNGVGVWSMDEEMIDIMKESGCLNINFPVESGSQNVLNKIIKKPLEIQKVKKLTEYCKKIGMRYGMFLVVGMPGEKLNDIWRSFRFAAKCGCYTPHISVAVPYPGTEIFSICIEKNYFSREFLLDDLYIKSFMIETPDWTEKELRRVVSRGLIYLKVRGVVSNPLLIFGLIVKYLKKPALVISVLKKAIG